MVGFALTFIVLLSTKLIQATPSGNRDDLQDQEIAEMKKVMTLQSELIQSQAEMLQEYGERIAILEKENNDLVKQTERLRTANEVMESRLTHLDREDMDTRPEEDVHVTFGQWTEKIEDQERGRHHTPVNQGKAVKEDDGKHQRIQRVANVPDNPTAVGFSCRLQTPYSLRLGQHQTVEFDDVVTNVGNGYDSRHGHFTAPVAGLYSFFSTVLFLTSDSLPMNLVIVKNGDVVGHLYSSSAYDHGPRTVVLSLALGDMVWVRNNGDNSPSIDGHGYSTFSGFLITPYSQGN